MSKWFETKSEPIVSKSDYKYVGKNCTRIDAKDIVTGKAVFLDDYTVNDALICTVLKSPVPHAEITKIDTSRAKALPGVRAVLTYEDFNPEWGMGEPPMKPCLLYTSGKTATISTTVYQLWRTNDDGGAMTWVLINLAISAVVLLAVNLLEKKNKQGRAVK